MNSSRILAFKQRVSETEITPEGCGCQTAQGGGLTTQIHARMHIYNFTAGPQFAYSGNHTFQPFVRALAGGAFSGTSISVLLNNVPQTEELSDSDTSFAVGGGAGTDIRLQSISLSALLPITCARTCSMKAKIICEALCLWSIGGARQVNELVVRRNAQTFYKNGELNTHRRHTELPAAGQGRIEVNLHHILLFPKK